MYHAVIFDLDGTLLDTIGDLADAANWVCAQNGWPAHSIEEYKHFVGNGIPRLVERFSPPACRTPEKLAATLRAFTDRYAAHRLDRTAPYSGIPELLAELTRAGVPFACVSNKDDALVRSLLRTFFGDCFAAVQGRSETVPPKPDPTGTRLALAALGADAAQTLFVGDSDVDIQTGQAAGLPTCGVLWGFRDRAELENAGARYIAASPGQLARLILD